jgi:hypothetical protein
MNYIDSKATKVTTDEAQRIISADAATQPALFGLIDKTIEALVRLDSDALLALEQQASEISSTPLALSAEMIQTLHHKNPSLPISSKTPARTSVSSSNPQRTTPDGFTDFAPQPIADGPHGRPVYT